MDRFKFKSFLTEFPFLKNLGLRRIEEVDLEDFEIKVHRLDESWLTTPPKGTWHVGSCVDICNDHQIFAVLNDQTVIDLEVENRGNSGSNYAHEDDYYYEGETVLEALDRWIDAGGGNPELIVYFVDYKRGIYTHEHHSYGARLDILKPEKGVTISQRLDEAQKEAEAQVRAEANF